MNAETYATYSDKRLAEMHAYWMSICRTAKSPEQRARAERGATIAATELRKRIAVNQSRE